MYRIGATFRQLRRSKRISLERASRDIVTIAFLSKFERGKSDISITNFMLLLDRINVEITEIIHLNQISNGIELDFKTTVSNYYLKGDVQHLQMLQQSKEQHDIDDVESGNLKNVMLEALICSLTNKKLSAKNQLVIINHLTNVESWTAFELYLFGNTLFTLPIQNVVVLTNLMYKKGLLYKELQNDNVSSIFRILNNAISYCCDYHYYDDAWHFLKLFQSLIDHPRQLYERMKYLNLKGLLTYLTKDKNKGLNDIRRSLTALRILNDETVYKREVSYLEKILSTSELELVQKPLG